jgi:hypothetical protein
VGGAGLAGMGARFNHLTARRFCAAVSIAAMSPASARASGSPDAAARSAQAAASSYSWIIQ